VLLGPFLWCFGSVLVQDRSFGFRDAANYYYPLFEWECGEWRAGRVPLWNPLDDLGTPALADATSSVLYPGKLVFLLPVSYGLRYHLFVSLHVLFAASATYTLARHWQASRDAATLAALAYAFGGSVLFQHCNVVFLVGASWLPWALYATDRMLAESSASWAVGLGAVLALMTLGGDPQAAYHGGLLALLYVCLYTTEKTASEPPQRASRFARLRPLALLAVAAAAGCGFAAVQILPSLELSRQSDRASFGEPRSLYELATGWNDLGWGHQDQAASGMGSMLAGMLASPEPGTHLRQVYYYSVGPWHLAGLLWPNGFGRIFPWNERWISALPAEGRTWTPSLYLGLLPLLLAASSWQLRHADARVRLASWMVLLGFVGSCGWYGLGWVFQELSAGLTGADSSSWIGEPVGGLYWLMVVLLPGYVCFRYPAKLLVVAALGISLLAARGWDRMAAGGGAKIRTWCLRLTMLSFAVVVAFALTQAEWTRWIKTAPVDAIFGPLDNRRATAGVLTALAHTAALGLVLWWLLGKSVATSRAWSRQVLLGVTAVELCVANGWMIATVPVEVWQQPDTLAGLIVRPPHSDVDLPPRLLRDANSHLYPSAWSQHGSLTRVQEVVAWEQATLSPRHHLRAGVACLPAHTTLRTRDWQAWLRLAGGFAKPRADRSALLRPLSLAAVVTREAASWSGYEHRAVTSGVSLWHDRHTYPRAWIVHRVRRFEPLEDLTHQALEQRTQETLFDGSMPRDLRSIAVIETKDPSVETFVSEAASGGQEVCHITRYDSQLVELQVTLSTAGCLVFNDAFAPGWQAERVTQGTPHVLPVLRANRVMRAVMLPPGEHHVRFVYRPHSFLVGAAISAAAWLILCVAWAIHMCRAARFRFGS